MKWPRTKSLDKFKDALRNKTRRTQGQSLSMVIAGLNPVMRGWFEYFKHSHWTTFGVLSIWRKHETWPHNLNESNPPTGEPYAGNPHVRFGGRGEVQSLVPTPINAILHPPFS